MKKKARRLTYWSLGLGLLPLLWGVLHQTGLMVPNLMQEGVASWWRYAAGGAAYIALERVLTRPMWLYVVGHELTHVISGWMSGAKVHSFKAKSSGGEVRLSKSNAFIALSPYIFPLYALVLVGAYAVTRHFWEPSQLRPIFEFLFGASVAFHVSLTVSAIHKHQPDLKVLGHFLSSILILLGNVLIIAFFGISLFSRTPRFENYMHNVGMDTLTAWKKTWNVSVVILSQIVNWIQEQKWTH